MFIQLHMGVMPLNCWNLFKSESVSFEDDVQSKAIINVFQDEYKHGSSVEANHRPHHVLANF